MRISDWSSDVCSSDLRDVVSHVDVAVHPAQVVGLLGPNGAGKTTTFNMLAGGVRPTDGQVRLGDKAITELPMYPRARLEIGRASYRERVCRSVESPVVGDSSKKKTTTKTITTT